MRLGCGSFQHVRFIDTGIRLREESNQLPFAPVVSITVA